MVSDSQKKARDRWDSVNMGTIGCKLRKPSVDAFKAICEASGLTANKALTLYIEHCIAAGSLIYTDSVDD